MLTARRVLIALVTVTLGACSWGADAPPRVQDMPPIHVETDVDSATNFATYSTWNWVPGLDKATGDPRVDSREVRVRIGTAVQEELFKRGFAKVDGTADLMLSGYLTLDNITQDVLEQYYEGENLPTTDATPERVMSNERLGSTVTVEAGTLILFLIDAKSGQVVYRSTAQAQIVDNPQMTDKMRDERVAEAVKMMFEKLPARG